MKKADRDRIRAEAAALAESKKQQPAAPQVPQATVAQKPIGKPPVPKGKPLASNQVTFSCGHTGNAPLCSHCRTKRNKLKQEKIQKKRAAQYDPEAYRLPDGADYHVVYSAAEKQWSGALIVQIGQQHEVFTNKKSSLFKLLVSLDRMYREKSGIPWPEANSN